ncbi:hypothetical protein [Flavobacterium sp.]
MRKVLIFLFVFSLISCKDEKTENTETKNAVEQPAGNDFYSITMDVVAQKDDSFHVLYTEDGSNNFEEINSVWAEFKGSPNSQKLVFNLKEGAIPNQLRLDFGLNKDQGDVKLNSVEIAYLNNKVTFTGPEIFKYFRPNEASTIVDINTQTLKPLNKGGNTSLYPLEPLKPELEKLLR